MEVYLGLDLGTTGMKAVLCDSGMNVLKCAHLPSPMIANGETREFNADDFCMRVFRLIQTALKGTDPRAVRAVSIASASGNTVFLDERCRPLCNCFSWTDGRVQGREEEYLPGFDLAGVYEKVGWPYIGMFPLTHIAWIKKERPDIYGSFKMICMSTEYLIYALCGKWGLDASDATTFYLSDQMKGDYCREYLDYFGIDKSSLPPIYPSKVPLGEITEEVSAVTGLAPGTKVVLGSFDHPSCARGMGIIREGDLLLSCGTSWVGLFVSPDRARAIEAGLLVDPYMRDMGLWACMYAMTQYGEVIDSAVCGYIDDSEKRYVLLDSLAGKGMESGKTASCCLLDDSYREQWAGLSKEEIAFSILKSSCADARDGIIRLEKYGFIPKRIFMAGGPASGEIWPQILADTLGRDVYCLHRQYGGAVGAALMAAIGAGKFADERAFFKDRQNKYTVYTARG